MTEAPHHPHHEARNTFTTVDGIVQPAPAPRFSRTVPDAPTAAVEPSTDLEAALAPWGFSAEEMRALCESRAAA
jgi:alpha-methylacyl-CoA racemase